MAQYIDKSAIIAEIRSLQDSTMDEYGNFYTAKAQAEYNILCMLEIFLDTIETKEVDLEEELNEWRHNHFHGQRDDKGANGEYLTRVSQLEIARYFYELGLKTNGG